MRDKDTIELGDRVKDKITGFSGIVIAQDQWLTGCSRVAVQPESLDKDGKVQELRWIDEDRIVVIDINVHPVSQLPPAGPQPAKSDGMDK